MFEVGDFVIHPMHGAGKIIEKKMVKVLNVDTYYYVMTPLIEKLNKVMFPVDKVKELNIRKAISKKAINNILKEVDKYDTSIEDDAPEANWNVNYKKNMEILKSGNITNIGILCKKIIFKNLNKVIGTKEEELLTMGHKMLISEIILSLNLDIDEATEKLQKIIGKLTSPSVKF